VILTQHFAERVVNRVFRADRRPRNRQGAREQLPSALTIESLQVAIGRRHV
jgi:hypothetical protein